MSTKKLQLIGDLPTQSLLDTAAVGQIPQVTAIDENGKPTAWAATDLGDLYWEEVFALELTEEVSEILIPMTEEQAQKINNAYEVVFNSCLHKPATDSATTWGTFQYGLWSPTSGGHWRYNLFNDACSPTNSISYSTHTLCVVKQRHGPQDFSGVIEKVIFKQNQNPVVSLQERGNIRVDELATYQTHIRAVNSIPFGVGSWFKIFVVGKLEELAK